VKLRNCAKLPEQAKFLYYFLIEGEASTRGCAAALAVALIVAAVAAGCGGDDGNASGETNPGTEFTSAVDPALVQSIPEGRFMLSAGSICDASWARMLDSYELLRRERPNSSEGDLFDAASQQIFLPGMQFWFDDIDYLAKPPEDKDEVELMLAEMQRAVYAGQEQRVPTPRRFEAIFARFNRLARDYGLHNCLVTRASFKLGT
jgi:hypothetical protein